MDVRELELVDALVERQEISPEQHEAVLQALTRPPDRSEWAWFLYLSGLGFGVSLALAGVLYLVAFNWSALGFLSKEAAVFLALFGAGAVAVVKGPSSLPGQLGCAAAVVLSGAALVIYSQVYQSGADPWQLFAAWSVLAAPFVLASRTPALWALQLLLIDTTFATALDDADENVAVLIWTALAAGHVALGQLWEGSWLQHLLRVAGMFVLIGFGSAFAAELEPAALALPFALVVAGGLVVQAGYLMRWAAAPAATLGYVGLAVVGFTLGVRGLLELNVDEWLMLLSLGPALALVCAVGFVWLIGVPRLQRAGGRA